MPYSILGLAVIKVDNVFPNKNQPFAALINSVSTIEFGIFYNLQFNIMIFSLPLSKVGGKVSFVLPPPHTHTLSEVNRPMGKRAMSQPRPSAHAGYR